MLHRPAEITEYIQLQYLLDGPEQTPPPRPGPHEALRPPLSLRACLIHVIQIPRANIGCKALGSL